MKCVIREWKTGDKADLAKILNNQNIQNNLRDGLPYPYTEDDAEEYIKSMLCADKSNLCSITAEDEDKVVGSISILRCENIHSKTAEIGYISEPYWGKGYATNAVRQACSMNLKI